MNHAAVVTKASSSDVMYRFIRLAGIAYAEKDEGFKEFWEELVALADKEEPTQEDLEAFNEKLEKFKQYLWYKFGFQICERGVS